MKPPTLPCCLIAAAMAMPCMADTITFEPIVQTGDPIPGMGVTFNQLSRATQSQGNFAWRGAGSGVAGIYALLDGDVQVIAQTGTEVPGMPGMVWTSAAFTNQLGKIDGTSVAFRAGNGIYATFDGGPLERIADNSQINPGTGSPYATFQQPYISDGVVTFSNGPLFASATVSEFANGTVSNVWNSTTALPAPMSGTFSGVGQAPVNSGTIAAQVFDSALKQCILTNRGGSMNVVASAYENMPGQDFPFTQFLDPGIFGDRIAFIAWGPGGSGPGGKGFYKGIYEDINGSLSMVVDTETAVPGSKDLFLDFARGPAVYEDSLLFGAAVHGSGLDSVYMRYDGELLLIVDTTQTIDGKQITAVNINSEALISRSSGTFLATFDDGSQTIYTFSIDEGGVACVGDLDGSDAVNVSDLLALLSDWGPCSDCAADLTGDDQVNVSDLLALLAAWGPCDGE